MAKRREKFGIGPGTYCGTVAELTGDHVIPACLFEDGKASADTPTVDTATVDTPTVLACRRCNNERKNLDDSYSCDLLVSDYDAYQHPIARKIMVGPALRAARGTERVQSPFAHAVHQQPPRRVPIHPPSGIYIGDAYAIDLPTARIGRIFARMVRGLSRADVGTPLADRVNFSRQRLRDTTKVQGPAKQIVEDGGYRRAGDGRVFQCVYFLIDGQPEKSTWMLAVYEYLIYAARTGYPSVATPDKTGTDA
ncbi:MAG TPA: hypothetical protein VGP82_08045 [Ktedonobacterales bacterium]|jgi:hypothetical protein|nr:hypothetical protein [Ktedonobacterales bacterium]